MKKQIKEKLLDPNDKESVFQMKNDQVFGHIAEGAKAVFKAGLIPFIRPV
jgi:hypothetical protein